MCQSGLAKLNQLINALHAGRMIKRPASKEAGRRAARLIKQQWVKNPQRLAAVKISDTTNEIQALFLLKDKEPDCAAIVQAIVEELCQNPPQELAKDKAFMAIRRELAYSIRDF